MDSSGINSYHSYETGNASQAIDPYSTIINSQTSNIRLISQFKAQRLIIYDAHEKKFELLDSAEKSISEIKGDLYVISNSGSPGAGKSTILNIIVHILSFLNDHHLDDRQKLEDQNDRYLGFKHLFAVGDGDSSTTEELDYLCLKYGSAHILFLDLEGNDDLRRKEQGIWVYSNLISTALAVSHIHLYNYKGVMSADFLEYFKDTQTIIKQRKLHNTFDLQVYAVKKDDRSQKPLVTQEKILDKMKANLQGNETNYHAYLLKTPPECDCMNSQVSICDACKKSSYILGVEGLVFNLLNCLESLAPYSNGREFLSIFNSILATNERDLPYEPNYGDLAKIMANKLREEELRINEGLANVYNSTQDKEFSQNILNLFKDKPDFISAQELEDFGITLNLVFHKLPQLEFLSNQLSNFVTEFLDTNQPYSVLNQNDVESILKIYVDRFKTMMNEVLQAFSHFQRLLAYIESRIGNLKNDFRNHLSKYIRALHFNKAQNVAVGIPSLSAPILGIIARDVATKAVAWGFAGMAALVGFVALYAYYEARKTFSESKTKDCKNLNIEFIPDLTKERDEKKQMTIVEDYLRKMVKSLQQKNATLRFYLQNEAPNEEKLKDKLQQMLEMKLKSIEFTPEDKQELKDLSKRAQTKVLMLNNCI